ncbi:transposase [Desulfarculales bacterium]
MESLYPMGRNDRDGSRVLDEDIASALVRLRRELPPASVITFTSEMMRRRLTSLDVVLKASTVYRFLHQQGLMGKQVAPPVDRKRFEAERPNDIWHSDPMHGPMLLVDDNRRKTYLFAFIDDMSRLIVHAEFASPRA